VMERECARALARGRTVLALDRGAETPDGVRGLLEGRALRLPWRGAEEAAREIAARLSAGESSRDRARDGWAREIGQFLARACAAVGGRESLPGGLGAFPHTGAIARVAAAWSRGTADNTAGFSCLLADLVYEGEHPPTAPTRLLARVRRGG